MNNNIIKTNSDFLFIYEAIKTNPNGDPDMENKPRMDYDTKTNLVTDLRIKRNIREYLKDSGKKIFVDTLEGRKVTVEKMLNCIADEIIGNKDKLNKLFAQNDELKALWNSLINGLEDNQKKYNELKEISKSKKDKNIREQFLKLNDSFLQEIIKQELIDIRMFGGAFAVEGFPSTYTGAIQLNWGYSLHPVEMIKSNTLVTIMNEDASTMGKDYRLYYSLIAFHGTINKHAAKTTGLTQNDLNLFREAIINSVSYKPTRSKSDQYPMLYLELEYDEKYNGYLRDLRDFLKCTYDHNEPIRSIDNLKIDVSELTKLINNNKKIVEQIHLWKTPLSETAFDKFTNDLKGIKINEISLAGKE